jgi:hypothetical protein
MQHNQQLNEGMRALDLKDMIHPMFEVDTFRSKMGEDRDVCVVSFQVKDRNPAKDLMEFIEKGYDFVLDADVASGENNKGEYAVFVELSRTPKLAEQIKDLTRGVKKLTGIEEFTFKYHQESNFQEVNEDILDKVIPNSPQNYDLRMNKYKTESIKRFFSKTLMDDLTLEGDIITIHKPFDRRVQLRMVKEGTVDAVLEETSEPITMDDQSTSEIFWLTKVLGDYNINKVGNNFIFDNNGQAMLLQRI